MRLRTPLPLLLLQTIGIATSTSTYQLSYDGITEQQLIPTLSSTPEDILLVEDLAASIGASFLSQWVKTKIFVDTSPQDYDLNIQKQCYKENSSNGYICMLDYIEDGIVLRTFLNFYPMHPQECPSEQCMEGDDTIAVRIDATLNTDSNDQSQEIFISSVPQLDDILKVEEGSIWSIQLRTPATELFRMRESVIPETAHAKPSFKETMLADQHIKDKKRLFASSRTEVWSYRLPGSMDSTTALFLDGKLRILSSLCTRVHAEAFIHPGMIAHPYPTRVAVISRTPLPFIKEILKYKSVEVVELVGVDLDAMEASQMFLSELDDCSAMEDLAPSCMQNDAVVSVEMSANDWLDVMIQAEGAPSREGAHYAEFPEFDVIFVDADENDWLDLDFQSKLEVLMEDEDGESLIVINSGHAPSLDQGIGPVDLMTVQPRDELLRQATRDESHGGLDYAVAVVYDEPLTLPLNSAFIILFDEINTSYTRFFRRSFAAIDLDLVSRLHPSPGQEPTVLYDGPTHQRYKVPSRAWETWYCNTHPWSTFPICATFLNQLFDPSYHHSNTEVRQHPIKGRTLHTLEDVPKGHFLLPEDTVWMLHFDETEWNALNKFVDDFPHAEMYEDLRDFVVAYGYESKLLGKTGWSVTLATNCTFINHACTKEEWNNEYLNVYESEDNKDWLGFSPTMQRRAEMIGVLSATTRDIKAGEEILMNYTYFRDEAEEHPEFLAFLKKICNTGEGLVPLDEEEDSSDDSSDD